jgi:MFS family permease
MKKRELISIVFVMLLILVLVMDVALLLPNEVLIAADIDIYFDAIGLLIGIYTIINGGSILIFGYLADKINRKRILIIAGLLWSVAAILHIFIFDFWQLILFRLLAAIATSVATPIVISYLADIISPKSRSKSLAFWGLISSFASIVAGVIALAFNPIDYSALESLTIPEKINTIQFLYPEFLHTWTYPYFYLGIFAIIITILAFFFIIEPKRASKEEFFQELLAQEKYSYTYKITIKDLKFIFTRKSNFFLIMNFFDVIFVGLFLAYIFPYINLELGINFIDLRVIVFLLFALVLGLIIGQFILAHWGDKRFQKGDINGRVKVAVICSIATIPFLMSAFAMSPKLSNNSFFFNTIIVNDALFWVFWLLYSSLLGIGIAFEMGIGPNWYSSVIDVNYPENRGSMIAIASFVDAIGRAIGAIIGGIVVTATGSFSATIFWSTLIFGSISTIFWIPLFYTSKKDLMDVRNVLKERAAKMQPNNPDEK